MRRSHAARRIPEVYAYARDPGPAIEDLDGWEFSHSRNAIADELARADLAAQGGRYRDVNPAIVAREERAFPLPFRATEIEPAAVRLAR
ncbi:MAG: hypothetical protein K0S56_568 [Microvirga sp.]|nr:hypothetical protein [Microvirga sp.]